MNRYLVIALIMVILIAGCKAAPKAPTTTTSTAQASVDTASDITPAEKLDNELDTEGLDALDNELDDLNW